MLLASGKSLTLAAGVALAMSGLVGAQTTSLPVRIVAVPAVLGEGDRGTVIIRRDVPGPERIDLTVVPAVPMEPPQSITVATWPAGAAGDYAFDLQWLDDLRVTAEVTDTHSVNVYVDGQYAGVLSWSVRFADNDHPDLAVQRVVYPGGQMAGLLRVFTTALPREIVVDRTAHQELSVATETEPEAGIPEIRSPLTIHANGASLREPDVRRARPVFRIAPEGRLQIDHAGIRLGATPTTQDIAAFENRGTLYVSRSHVTSAGTLNAPLFENSGNLRIERTSIDSVSHEKLLEQSAGESRLVASTLSRNHGWTLVDVDAGILSLEGVTLSGNVQGFAPLTSVAGSLLFGHTLIQGNQNSQMISPGIDRNCSAPGSSLGGNIEDRQGCGFVQATDRAGLRLDGLLYAAELRGYVPVGAAVDAGAAAGSTSPDDCAGIDQRGAPRPQTLASGTIPRCDSGAIELGVNPRRGIWQPARSGHGVELHTAGNRLLLLWYTYDDSGAPVAYQAIAPLTGPHWETDLLLPRRDLQTGAVSTTVAGRVTLQFTADDDALLGWRFAGKPAGGSERIRPAVFGSGEPRFDVTGIWYPPAESGQGLSVTRQGDKTAVVAYYFDASGIMRWALGARDDADALQLPMSSFTGFCPDCDASRMPLAAQPAGDILLHFHTPRRARLDPRLAYPAGAGGGWQRERLVLQTLSDPAGGPASVPGRE